MVNQNPSPCCNGIACFVGGNCVQQSKALTLVELMHKELVMTNDKRSYIIFSVNQTELEQQENKTHYISTEVAMEQKKINFRELVATNKEEEQRCFIVPNTPRNMVFIKTALKQFNQIGYLRLDTHKDNMYNAYVVDTKDGEVQNLGYFRSFPRSTIHALGMEYSFHRKDINGYFTIWDTDTTNIGELQDEVICWEAVNKVKRARNGR